MSGRGWRSLAGWVALSFVPAVIGAPFPAPEWYRQLRKPSWSPPAWLFGPVWTLLYALMGVAAWLVATGGRAGGRGAALGAFGAQLALNAAWTPIFFGLRRPGLALAEIMATLGAVAATVALFLRQRTLAGVLLLPYLAWTSFATLLNAAIWRRNRDLG
ncbi:MAG TPA: TspO/MBR family protein [Candidatus Limnocylindria bacterium]